jgi:anthranilate synthase component 1
VPEAYFAVTETLIVFDHLRHKVLVISLVDAANLRDVEGEGFAAAYRGQPSRYDAWLRGSPLRTYVALFPTGTSPGRDLLELHRAGLRGGVGEGQGVHPGGDASRSCHPASFSPR